MKPQDQDLETTSVIIRHVREEDAEKLLSLHVMLDEGSAFMLFEPGERSTDVEAERERIRGVLSRSNQSLIVAETRGQLVGYVAVLGGLVKRNRHRGHLVIGVLQAFSGQGIGGRLLEEAERWALSAGLHRLDLTVMTHNARAIHLYEKMGFVREGTAKDALCVNGAYVDEYYMAKLLLPAAQP